MPEFNLSFLGEETPNSIPFKFGVILEFLREGLFAGLELVFHLAMKEVLVKGRELTLVKRLNLFTAFLLYFVGFLISVIVLLLYHNTGSIQELSFSA